MMKVFGVAVFLLAVFISTSKGAKMEEYKMETFSNGAYKVMWKYDMIKDYFFFNVTVNATGWIGFGVSNSKGGMNGYDVIVGGYRASHMNKTYWNDYYTTGYQRPSPDAKNDYMLTSAMEMDGYTNLVFHRKRKTADTSGKDVDIKPGMMYLVWAYHNTYDVNATTGAFMKHSEEGAVQYSFIDAKYTIVTISDKYRLYWAYDNKTEMFYFTVVVKAAGWVAFGVSNKRGGMDGYDVFIGGVDGNGGYIGDYLTTGLSKPPKDTEQNWNLTSYEERDGYTKLTVHRKKNTGDSKDVEIKPGEMNILWAYHNTDDVMTNDAFTKHSARGGMKYTFIKDTSGGGGDGNGDGNGDGDGGKDSSSMYYPSVFGIIALLLFQFVMRA